MKPIIFIESLSFVKESDKLALDEVYVPQLDVKPGNATLSALKWESSKRKLLRLMNTGILLLRNMELLWLLLRLIMVMAILFLLL